MNWNEIRTFYAKHNDAIMSERSDRYAIDPYELEVEFTPIERAFWHDIRCKGIVMYPQYPVGRVFVDFANPVAKVAVECDGKQWHDAEKDAIRDAKLAKLGWTVYRITGSDCLKDYIETETGCELSPGQKLTKFLEKKCKT